VWGQNDSLRAELNTLRAEIAELRSELKLQKTSAQPN
jgi:hypothetical protein